jgi:hypothetical protein
MNERSMRAICEVQIQNFHAPVGEIIPELDGEFAKNVNVHAPPNGIVFHVIGKTGRKRRDVAEALEQVTLFARSEGAEKIENINGNEQP